MVAITPNWRDIGDTTVEEYRKQFAAHGSPMDPDLCFAAARPHSAVLLAISEWEQKHKTHPSPIPASFNNPLSMGKPEGGSGLDRWERFPSDHVCFSECRGRITSRTYKPQDPGVYARTTSLRDLVYTYTPPHDNNPTEAVYQRAVEFVGEMESPEGSGSSMFPTYPVLVSARTGQTITVSSPVPIVRAILPISAARPGQALTDPRYWIQHETDNPRPQTGARSHYNWLMGQLQIQTSFHFVVDDGVIYHLVPLLEVTWQAADGNGPGNHSSWSCEGCINSDGNEALMRRNCEYLAAGVLDGMAAIGYGGGASDDDVKRHWDFNAGTADRHHCPDHMMTQGYWPTFVANVRKIRAGDDVVPVVYAKPNILQLGEWDGRDRILPDGTVLRACMRTLVARRETKRLQVAATNAREIGPKIKKGQEVPIQYVFQAGNTGTRYAYTEWGTRLVLSHFEPYITFASPR